jgi:hypothetical protein
MPPTLTITSPRTRKDRYFTRSSSINISGNADDNQQIDKVVWKNSSGVGGTCDGTSSWQANDIPLGLWWNTITLTAIDTSGNTSETSLTVFCWKR